MKTLNPTERHIAARHIAGAAAHQVDRVMSVIFWCTFAIGVASVTAIALFLYSLAANLPSI